MRKALLLAPMGSVHRRFNQPNINALLSLGYEVHLLANFENGEGAESQNQEYANLMRNQGIIIHSLPYKRHSLLGNLPTISPTREIISGEQFSLVHTHTETGGLILRLCGKERGTKYIYTSHGFSFYKGSSYKTSLIYKPIERWICKIMDLCIAINNEDYEVQNLWNKEGSVFTHGVGVDLDRFSQVFSKNEVRQELNIPESAKVILCIGELDENKNHMVVIDALAKIEHNKNIFCIICGVGPNKEKLISRARSLGVSDNLRLVGFRKDIPNIIADSDVFVFPSYHEGLPVALMEAMAGGLPVVCSNIRGCTDLIDENKGGFWVNPTDINNLYMYLRILLDNPDKQKMFGEYNKIKVKNYAKEVVTNELMDIYQMV